MVKKKSTLRRMGDAVAGAASSVGKALGLTGGKKKKSGGEKAGAKKKPAAKAGAKKTGAKKSAAKKK